ncbi:hypothetical protein CcCBS67573_g08983 [Chytriomyces confervae]|uniref:Chromate transporter n=1 Tax=Chytriomyces confervae TaxID=246404 RepID=A0A507E9W8_9FUNG|nr:hypothetical protein CcCBS67573_g08983 [Chytriomyces confervae]
MDVRFGFKNRRKNQTATQQQESNQTRPNHIPLGERLAEVVLNYFPLSYITWGGPQVTLPVRFVIVGRIKFTLYCQASIAVMLNLFVVKKKWISEEMFAELYAISNALPGPPASQLAFTIALIRGGVLPAVVSFLVWSLPGAIVMGTIGHFVGTVGTTTLPPWVTYISHSLAAVGVALVAFATKQLAGKLMFDKTTCTIAALTVMLVVNFTSAAWLIPSILVSAGLFTYGEHFLPGCIARFKERRTRNSRPFLVSEVVVVVEDAVPQFQENLDAIELQDPVTAPAVITTNEETSDLNIYFSYSTRTGIFLIAVYIGVLVLSIILRQLNLNLAANIFSQFYFVGAIIFGGGSVAVPLLYSYVVSSTGWLTSSEFLMGVAVINAIPGPNFNFAAYCGALAFRGTGWSSLAGATLAWVAIHLPGLVLKAGVLPFWRNYRDLQLVKPIFKGLNSVAVGLMFSAVYLLWQKAISIPGGGAENLGLHPGWVAMMVAAFSALEVWRVPSSLVVLAGAVVGGLAWILFGRV